MSNTKYLRELLETVDVLNPERACERISEALQELRQVEADRAKDAELIQQMLDVLRKSLDPLAFAYQQARLPITQHEFRKTYKLANDILNAAEAAGFKPSEP
jgi:hypothetical protein